MAESPAGHPAVLLINHGSRQPHAAAFVRELAETLRRDDHTRTVAVGFLERNRPTPGQALGELARGGAGRVQVVPLLFSAGYHYRIDIPAALDAAQEVHPAVQVEIAPPLLADSDSLVEALDARLSESAGGHGSAESGWLEARPPDGLVLLAAGSGDPHARARVSELADTWGRSHGVPAEVAFCDLRGEEVRTAVAKLVARGADRVACGALFLASGRLLDAGHQAALAAGAVTVAPALGMTPALVDLIRRRCWEPVPAG